MEVTPNAWFPVLDGPECPPDPPHLTLNQRLQTELYFQGGADGLHRPRHLVTACHTPVPLTALRGEPTSWLATKEERPLFLTFTLKSSTVFYRIISP
jgi:hypothetical protein